jgi:exopolyphosphatase/guanosine-5'-triphosphate,3'-diphosphate pyrophosphatase
MICACIDIGSNTTRVLVADIRDGRLRAVLQERAFTRIGKDLESGDVLSAAKIAEVSAVVAHYCDAARAHGVQALRAVATAAIRSAANRDELIDAVRSATGIDAEVLDPAHEARLAFAGATRTFGEPLEGRVAVVDVGGGSSEIAVGTLASGVTWSASVTIGSGLLADAHLRGDPPSPASLEAVRRHAEGAFAGLDVPRPDCAVAVGGSATSLRRLVGSVLEPGTMRHAMGVLAAEPADAVASRLGLDAERVRLLPAGILILDAAASRLGCALQIARGGLREGVCLELAAGAASTS